MILSDFESWIRAVNNEIKHYGLNIDEFSFTTPDSYIAFLDIQFTFTSSGDLQTDLYVKPTDSRSYLNFGSAHPRHTFTGVVYSAFLRLRRIINNSDRLANRIEELKVCFKASGYPVAMIDRIAAKVLGMERSLKRRKDEELPKENETPTIRVVSTFGSDSDLVKSCEKFEKVLSRTRTFSLPQVFTSPTPSPVQSRAASPAPAQEQGSTGKTRRLFSYVKKTGGNICSRVVRSKELALGKRFGKTKPCKHRNCMCCNMISSRDCYKFNKKLIKTAEGSCASYNIVYLVVCDICKKHYIGRSTRQLNTRIGEHRRNFYQIVDKKVSPVLNFCSDDKDDYALGAHLYNHGYNDKSDFSKFYKVCILENCSPKVLEVKEHKFIHKLNSLNPFGINLSNPFSIPSLYSN